MHSSYCSSPSIFLCGSVAKANQHYTCLPGYPMCTLPYVCQRPMLSHLSCQCMSSSPSNTLLMAFSNPPCLFKPTLNTCSTVLCNSIVWSKMYFRLSGLYNTSPIVCRLCRWPLLPGCMCLAMQGVRHRTAANLWPQYCRCRKPCYDPGAQNLV